MPFCIDPKGTLKSSRLGSPDLVGLAAVADQRSADGQLALPHEFRHVDIL
jgi:hypothetical protein